LLNGKTSVRGDSIPQLRLLLHCEQLEAFAAKGIEAEQEIIRSGSES